MSGHGNSGFRVRNLRGTSDCNCRTYRLHRASLDSTTRCAAHGCPYRATRACHVVSANQNARSGVRFLVYMCPHHNGIHGIPFSIRLNARHIQMPECYHGYD